MFQIGPAVHEIFHAMGAYHTQSRSDRDKYVKVNIQNVNPIDISNYDREVTNNYNVTYDYYSVMHYGEYVRANL